jgi:hypothetical protein
MDIRNQGVSAKRFSNDNGHGSGLNQKIGSRKFTKERFYLHEKIGWRELLKKNKRPKNFIAQKLPKPW